MPLITPRVNENKSTYIARCMSHSIISKEFPDIKQRLAVCNSLWKKHLAK